MATERRAELFPAGRTLSIPWRPHRLPAGAIVVLSWCASGATLCAQVPDDSALVQYARRAWRENGRAQVAALAGMSWDSTTGSWRLQPDWADAPDAAAKAYYLEPILRGVLGLAEATHDVTLLDQVARFYLAYQGRFTTVGDLLQSMTAAGSRSGRPQGDPEARTLSWLNRSANPAVPAECPLCNAQAFHPAARLIRLIAALPPEQRTPGMDAFVQAYTPFLIRDHLVRLGNDTKWEAGLPGARFLSLVAYWEVSSAGPYRGRYRMRDTDLWLMSTAAELLEANRLRPQLVGLLGEQPRLLRMVTSGMTFLRSSSVLHPATRDRAGRLVGSRGFFEGDDDNQPDAAYAGYVDSTYPANEPKRPPKGASWDISHIQRLPVALRSIWDARRAIRPAAPDSTFVAQTVNQYLYVCLRGDSLHPTFSNFFDGQDGWFRVAYAGRVAFGYAPSAYCDNRDSRRLCLGRWGTAGWGLLAFINPDLTRPEASLVALAAAPVADTGVARFRQRVYAIKGDDFKFRPDSVSPLLAELVDEYASGRAVRLASRPVGGNR